MAGASDWFGWCTGPKLFLQAMRLLLSTCFSSGSLEFWYKLGRGCLHNPSSINTLGTESLMRFPDRQHFTRCHNSVPEELRDPM